jgi:hypothetical protein
MLKPLIGVAILLATAAYAQPPQTLQKPVATDTVACTDENMPASKSDVVVSPSGLRARVSLQAKAAPGKNDDNQRCVTIWTAAVSRRGTGWRRVFEDQRNDDYEYSFEINGWSGDGKLLLMSMVGAAGDWDETTPVIYDADKNKSYEIELAPLFKAMTPKDCYPYFRPLGFNALHHVLLNAGDLETDRAPGEKPCFPNSLWELDYVQKRVKRVPEKASPEKFGTVAGEK